MGRFCSNASANISTMIRSIPRDCTSKLPFALTRCPLRDMRSHSVFHGVFLSLVTFGKTIRRFETITMSPKGSENNSRKRARNPASYRPPCGLLVRINDRSSALADEAEARTDSVQSARVSSIPQCSSCASQIKSHGIRRLPMTSSE